MEFIYRTEDIDTDEILDLFVETTDDRKIINALKSRNPVILVGSRGVGKSFLCRVAEAELLKEFETERIFPTYVTYNKSSLIHTDDPLQFQHWMMGRICSRLVRSLKKQGMLASAPKSISILSGGETGKGEENSRIENITEAYEASWKTPGIKIDITGLPTVDEFKDVIEDLCSELRIKRFVLLIDEAAHILLPEQQRQFFSLFRDLRSPKLSCNAAVYPGVTFYGDAFQPVHDATMLALERDIFSSEYISNMREMVEKQAEDSSLLRDIATHGENFAVLAYAASGNPRILLKTLAKCPKVTRQQVNDVIREYYRVDIWSEHSLLAGKYSGHTPFIDWGRNFIETVVLPELQRKNIEYMEKDKNTTCFFWVHRDSPQQVKEALRLLCYTGIVHDDAYGIKASRSEIGTRYSVNLGCLFTLEPAPASSALQIAKSLTPKRMTEYGANHSAYQPLIKAVEKYAEPEIGEVLKYHLSRDINVLDFPTWQLERVRAMGINTLGDLLSSTEIKIQGAWYIGAKRSRRIKNAAISAVYEYLSG